MTESIANSGVVAQAFRLLEMEPISSFGDDSEEAVAAADQYSVALDACLEYGDWSFARRLAKLPPVADEEALDPDLAHAYMRPSDLLAVRFVWPECAAWRLDADRLRSDQGGSLTIRYTARVRDETRLSGLFKVGVANRLASFLAPRWTTSRNRADSLAAASDDALAKALAADRGNASTKRYDGRPRQGDWAAEAVR